ncbi:MAG TPA: efflux RND transporter periplasmic adaptor subunit [Gammaproteobacteria bacterium]
MRAKPLVALVAAVAVAITAGYLIWSRQHAASSKESRVGAVPVLAASAERRPVPLRLTAVGTVTAVESVAVKSRIDGQIVQVGFSEGEEVKAGQTLFVIDPRAIQAQLQQAEANLARDQALLATTRADLSRYTDLAGQNLVSHQELEKAQASLAQLEAAIRADQAQVEISRVQLSYTTIRAPINGRTGARLLTRGNMVKANDAEPLVVINQLKPIDVTFAVAERELPAIRRAQAAGPVPVQAVVADDTAHPAAGALNFIDNAADPATATVQLKARFANDEQPLWPGQFVAVTLQLVTEGASVVVPAEAVQESQKGSYVYLIQADDTVELHPVRVERVDGGQAVIAAGLQGGEQVVTDGQLRLRPGAKISRRQNGAVNGNDGAAKGEGGAAVP